MFNVEVCPVYMFSKSKMHHVGSALTPTMRLTGLVLDIASGDLGPPVQATIAEFEADIKEAIDIARSRFVHNGIPLYWL